MLLSTIRSLLMIVFLICSLGGLAQGDGIGIGTNNVKQDAILEISSDNKGLLIPRMTTEDRLGMTPTSGGLMIYDTEKQAIFYYDSIVSSWKRLVQENSFGTIPLGGIIMWNGNSSNVPDGFELCDEEKVVNGFSVPNLYDRFVIGGSSAENLDTRVVVTDTLTYNYQIDGINCSPYENVWSGTITITEPPGGFPPPPGPGEPLTICGGLEDHVGESFNFVDVAMDTCDDITVPPNVTLIDNPLVRVATRCNAYTITNCTSQPNPNYYLNNEECRLGAQAYKIAFIMRVE